MPKKLMKPLYTKENCFTGPMLNAIEAILGIKAYGKLNTKLPTIYVIFLGPFYNDYIKNILLCLFVRSFIRSFVCLFVLGKMVDWDLYCNLFYNQTSWIKVQNLKNHEIRNLNLKTCRIPIKY